MCVIVSQWLHLYSAILAKLERGVEPGISFKCSEMNNISRHAREMEGVRRRRSERRKRNVRGERRKRSYERSSNALERASSFERE